MKVPSEQRPEGSERVNPGCLGESVPGREQPGQRPVSYMMEGGSEVEEGGRVRARWSRALQIITPKKMGNSWTLLSRGVAVSD